MSAPARGTYPEAHEPAHPPDPRGGPVRPRRLRPRGHPGPLDLDGEPVVWLSERAVLDGSAGLRGGVPICFPWFAAGPDGSISPNHGLVRKATWTPAETRGEEVWAWTLTSAELTAGGGPEGAEHLPGPFELRYAVSLSPGEGPRDSPALTVALDVHNPGATAYPFEVALHTYLGVTDVASARVLGLDGAPYLDKVTQSREVQEGPVRFEGETDNVYDSPGDPGLVLEGGAAGRVEIVPQGATQTVVWNPGPELSARTRDLGPGAWPHFVCVETAATADRGLTAPAGGTVSIGARFTVHPEARA